MIIAGIYPVKSYSKGIIRIKQVARQAILLAINITLVQSAIRPVSFHVPDLAIFNKIISCAAIRKNSKAVMLVNSNVVNVIITRNSSFILWNSYSVIL